MNNPGRPVPVAGPQSAPLALGTRPSRRPRKLGSGRIAGCIALSDGDHRLRAERRADRPRRRPVRHPERFHLPQHLHLRPFHPDAAVRHSRRDRHRLGAGRRHRHPARSARAHCRFHARAARHLRGRDAGLPLLHAPGHRRFLRGPAQEKAGRRREPARGRRRGSQGSDRTAPDARWRRAPSCASTACPSYSAVWSPSTT